MPHVLLFWASLISNNSKESTKLLWNISCCLLSNPTLRRLLHTILYENHFFRASCSNIKNGNGLLCHCPKSNGPFPSYATVGGRDSKNSPIFYYDNSCLLAKVTLWFYVGLINQSFRMCFLALIYHAVIIIAASFTWNFFNLIGN